MRHSDYNDLQGHDRRDPNLSIAALGGVGELTPDDLAAFAHAERAIYDYMADGLWHSANAIIGASGLRSGDRRMRSLRNRVCTKGGTVRYLHVLSTRVGARVWLHRIAWHTYPQRSKGAQA